MRGFDGTAALLCAALVHGLSLLQVIPVLCYQPETGGWSWAGAPGPICSGWYGVTLWVGGGFAIGGLLGAFRRPRTRDPLTAVAWVAVVADLLVIFLTQTQMHFPS